MVLLSCKSSTTQGSIPYQEGQIYSFEVKINSHLDKMEKVDTLILEIKKKGILGNLLGMNMSEWRSTVNPEYKEVRGINIEADFVDIQMPLQLDYLENENVIIAGYPSFSENLQLGSYSESEHHFPKSYGKLAGKVIQQHKLIVDSAEIEFNNTIQKCKVAEYKNLNGWEEFGLYKMKTYFAEPYGFLKIVYEYPNNTQISLELIAIE